MFTGIVEELGELIELVPHGDSGVVTVRGPKVAAGARHGESISVNGACLTVIGVDSGTFRADVMAETLKRTSLGGLLPGAPVNLERAVPVDGRLGGHVVQGHVDGTGVVVSRTPGDGWETVRFGMPRDLARFVAEKGSIAVDGVSLTVTAVGDDWFEVGLIPTTLALTTLGGAVPGAPVNLEVDVLAKYVERLLKAA
jgi:riboflavin synthase